MFIKSKKGFNLCVKQSLFKFSLNFFCEKKINLLKKQISFLIFFSQIFHNFLWFIPQKKIFMLSLKNKKKLFTISVYSFLDCFLKKTFKYFYLSKVFHKFLSQFKCKFKNGFGIQFYIFFLQKTYKNLYFFLHLSILKKYLYLPFLLKKFGKSFKKTKRVLGQDTFFFIFSKFFFNFFSFHRNFYFLFSNTSKMFCNVSSNFFLNFLNYSIYLFFFFF